MAPAAVPTESQKLCDLIAVSDSGIRTHDSQNSVLTM